MSALPPDGVGTPDDAAAGGKRKGRAKTHHTVAKAVGATMVVIALVTGLSVVFLYRHYNSNLNVKDITGPKWGGVLFFSRQCARAGRKSRFASEHSLGNRCPRS